MDLDIAKAQHSHPSHCVIMLARHVASRMGGMRALSSSAPVLNDVANVWAGVPMGPPDPILGLSEAFLKVGAGNRLGARWRCIPPAAGLRDATSDAPPVDGEGPGGGRGLAHARTLDPA